jgi:hypothetical protein
MPPGAGASECLGEMPLLTRGGVEPESIPSLHLGPQDGTGLGQGRSTKKRETLERSTITNRHSDPLLNPQPGRVGRFAPKEYV